MVCRFLSIKMIFSMEFVVAQQRWRSWFLCRLQLASHQHAFVHSSPTLYQTSNTKNDMRKMSNVTTKGSRNRLNNLHSIYYYSMCSVYVWAAENKNDDTILWFSVRTAANIYASMLQRFKIGIPFVKRLKQQNDC